MSAAPIETLQVIERGQVRSSTGAPEDGDQVCFSPCSPSPSLVLLAGEVLTPWESLNQVESIDMDAVLLGKASGPPRGGRADGIG